MFRPKAQPDSSRSALVKLLALAIGLVVVVAIMLHLYRTYLHTARSVAGAMPPGQWTPVAMPTAEPIAEFEARINLPSELPPFLTSPETPKQVTDFTQQAEHKPLMYLLYQAWQLRNAGLAERLEPRVTWQNLNDHPADYRGHGVPVKGKLQGRPSDQDFVPGEDTFFLTIYKSVVIDEEFHSYIVLTIEEPAGYSAGDAVDIPGLFMKMGAAPEGSVQAAPAVLVAFSLGTPAYLDDPAVLKNEAIDFNYLVPDRVTWYALNQLQKIPAEQLHRQAAPIADHYRQLMLSPETEKGKPFRLEGTLLYVKEESKSSSPLGIGALYRAHILDMEDHAYVCIVRDPPAGLLPEQDNVRAEGLFVQILAYESKAGTEVRAPVLVVDRLLRLTPPRAGRFVLAISAGLVACGVLLAIGVWYERRKDRRLAEQRLQRRLQSRPEDLKQVARRVQEQAELSKKPPPSST